MGIVTIRRPDLRRVRKACEYLQGVGGLEIRPLLWIHNEHLEYVGVWPDGSLHVAHERYVAIFDLIRAWRGWERPSVAFSDPSWPALSAPLPEPPPRPAA
jgi:hypothetical protein